MGSAAGGKIVTADFHDPYYILVLGRNFTQRKILNPFGGAEVDYDRNVPLNGVGGLVLDRQQGFPAYVFSVHVDCRVIFSQMHRQGRVPGKAQHNAGHKMLGRMLYRKIAPAPKIQGKLTGSRNQGAAAGKDMKYFSAFFLNAENLASVYRSPIRALAPAFGIKNGPVEHGRRAAAVRPDLAYFRRGLSVAVKINIIIILFCSHDVMIAVMVYFVHVCETD
jgi:hypothetical protein